MKFRNNQDIAKANFQLAPMIDIVFLLLIFFIVTWSFARFETEMDISVPATEEGKNPERTPSEIIINVKSDGTIIVNSKVRNATGLEKMLTQIAKIRKGQSVILRADKDTPYDNIIRVLAICHKSNIYNVAFATVHPKSKKLIIDK